MTFYKQYSKIRLINSVLVLLGMFLCCIGNNLYGQRQMEKLNRGLVAFNRGKGEVFVSWRLFGTEPADVAFNLYRKKGDDKPERLNRRPIIASTNYVDTSVHLDEDNTYFVKPVYNNEEGEAGKGFTIKAHSPVRQYISIPLRTPEGYTPNDVSVGDLDGDGEYDIIVHMVGKAKDNSFDGYTDPPIFDAYKMDGTFLWRINLGENIREGAHYTQFMVYDLDGDGKAEFVCKTADGTIDGEGVSIGDSSKNYVNSRGRILSGPEYLTVFEGETGKALATKEYIPSRGDISAWGGVGGNGGNDSKGNRANRFLAGIAYLDGKHPSLIMARGYYGRSVLAAWDWRESQLNLRWVFDSEGPDNPYSGQGNHSLSIADVDGDGKDEIVYGSMVVDNDGKGLYTTGLRHGDALHVGDLNPTRPGLEVYGIHEIVGGTEGSGIAMFDAKTGEILWDSDSNKDIGRGLVADIDPRYLGTETWGGERGLTDVQGNVIGKAPRSVNFAVWWDGDLLRELLDDTKITKWDWKAQKEITLFEPAGIKSNNETKATPALSADLFGDWREEVIWRTNDNKELRIYSTTIPTKHRFYTLMHNPQYRLSVAWQNVGYNQPPHTDYYLGIGMKNPPQPNIILIDPKGKKIVHYED